MSAPYPELIRADVRAAIRAAFGLDVLTVGNKYSQPVYLPSFAGVQS